MTGSIFLIAWLALGLIGLPFAAGGFAAIDSRFGRFAAAFGGAAVALTFGMILLAAAGLAATPVRISLFVLATVGVWFVGNRTWGRVRRIDRRALPALALAAIAVGIAAYAAGTARETSTDLLYFWGAKGQAFAAARGIDASFLAARDHFLLHPDYPPLLPCLYSFGTMAAGRFPWGAALLTAPLFLVLLLAVFWGYARDALGDVRAARWTALLGAMLGFAFLASEVAGNAEPPLLFFETLALGALIFGDRSPRGDWAASVALAGCALAKFEGAVFVAAAIAAFVVLERQGGRAARTFRLASLPAIALGAWIAFCARHGILDNYRGGFHGTFTLSNFSKIAAGIARSASYRIGFLPWIILIALAVLLPVRRRSLAPAAAGALFFVVNASFYFHGASDPTAWIDWSARRVLLTPMLCFLFAVAASHDLASAPEEDSEPREIDESPRDGDPAQESGEATSGFASRRTKTVAAISGLAALALLSRLPQILSRRLYLDGDECVLGVMAQHVLAGKPWPLFVYGQRYGVALFEVGAVAAVFRFFGPSAVAVKVAILAFWTVGVAFLAGAARRLGGPRAGLLTALLVLACPAWSQFSMKAWGGHVSAFVFSALTLYLAAPLLSSPRRDPLRLAILGLTATIVVLCQPLWAVGLVPILALVLVRTNGGERAAFVFGGIGVGAATFAATLQARAAYWRPPVFSHPEPLRALLLLPHRRGVFFSGAYYLQTLLRLSDSFRPIAILWCAATVAIVVTFIVRFLSGELRTVRQTIAAAVCATLLVTLAMNNDLYGFRYLLPLGEFLALSLSLELARLRSGSAVRAAAAAGLFLLLGSGALALWRTRRITSFGFDTLPDFQDGRTARHVIQYLEDRGIGDAYTMLPILQWTLMFEGRGRIQARWAIVGDRYPPAGEAVDRALREGKPVALVGTLQSRPDIQHLADKLGFPRVRVDWVDRWYWIVPNVPPGLIQKLHFPLSAPSSTPLRSAVP